MEKVLKNKICIKIQETFSDGDANGWNLHKKNTELDKLYWNVNVNAQWFFMLIENCSGNSMNSKWQEPNLEQVNRPIVKNLFDVNDCKQIKFTST